jgi:hypothetical protein
MRKPKKCPKCGYEKIAEILWGNPAWSKKLEKDLAAGKVALGGCCVEENNDQWQCGSCKHEWGRRKTSTKKCPECGTVMHGIGGFYYRCPEDGLMFGMRPGEPPQPCKMGPEPDPEMPD